MFKKIGIAFLALVFSFAFSACELFVPKAATGEKRITVVFDMTEYEGEINVSEGVAAYTDKVKEFDVTTKAERLETVLDELVEDKKITYGGEKGIYGLNILVIDNITLSGNQFFAIYTSDAENSDVAWGTYQYGGTTINSASWGVTSLPVKDGCVYVFAISAW
jgi:hypothetical protein